MRTASSSSRSSPRAANSLPAPRPPVVPQDAPMSSTFSTTSILPGYEISTDPRRLDVDLIHQFLNTSYWAEGRPRETVERSIRHSLCFGVYVADPAAGATLQVALRRLLD